MANLMMATAFENIQKTLNIGINIGMRIVNRIAHPSLGGQIHHGFKFFCSEQISQLPVFFQPHFDKTELLVAALQQGETRLFQLYRIIIIEIIQPNQLMPVSQQAAA